MLMLMVITPDMSAAQCQPSSTQQVESALTGVEIWFGATLAIWQF